MEENTQPQQTLQLFQDFSCLTASRHLKINVFEAAAEKKMKFVNVLSKT